MKICYVIYQMHSPGGVERTIHNRLLELCKLYDIYLITIDQGNRPYYFGKIPNITYIDLNIDYDRINKTYMKKNFKNFLKIVTNIWKLNKVLTKIKPDYIVSLSMGLSTYMLSAINYNAKLVYEHHASLYNLGFDRVTPNKYLLSVFNKFDKHVFLSEEEKELAKFILAKKFVIPNPVPKNLPNIIKYKDKQKRIIAAGRYVEVKGFERLLQAWKKIYLKFPDWRLEIYGDADEVIYPKIKNYIINNNMQERTFVFPATDKILEIINDSKIYAMTSHFENFPMVMLEALSLGTITVAFDCPSGPRNIINDTTGYLVLDDDIDLYARTLANAIENENEAMKKSAQCIIESKKYLLDEILKEWHKVFI